MVVMFRYEYFVTKQIAHYMSYVVYRCAQSLLGKEIFYVSFRTYHWTVL